MRILVFLFILLPGLLQANHHPEKGLKIQLAKATTDSAKVELACDLSDLYFMSDAKKAQQYASMAHTLAARINFPAGQAQALTLIGYAHMVAGEFDKAMKCYYQALHLGEKAGDNALIGKVYYHLGVIYRKLNDPTRAMHIYEKATQYARLAQDTLTISQVYSGLGNVYEDKRLYKKALALFKQAAEVQKNLGNKRAWAISLHNIGNVHVYFPQPEKGLPYLFQSLRLNNEIHNEPIRIATLASIAQIYEATGRPDAALAYAQQGYSLAHKTGSSKRIAAAAKFLQKLYKTRKEYEQAYTYLAIYDEHNELLKTANQNKIAAEMTIKYEANKKELENKRLKAEKEKQEIHLKNQQMKIFFGLVLLMVMLVLLLLLSSKRQKLKAINQKLQQANARMQAQNKEIIRQKEEISIQAVLLKHQNAQLEKDNIFKNKIFSIISHDLRSPFISITAFINLMHANKLMSPEIKPVIDIFSRDIDIITNMINNLLAWSKAQLAGDKLNMGFTDLFFLADENMELVSSLANGKNIRIINDIPDDTIVLTDKERLTIIIRNILSNAIKFTPDGGEIRLHVQEQLNTIALVVTDNGWGIPDKFMPRLFTDQRFTTLGTSKERGTGLGLMLCKDLIESIQGEISVQSQEGQGSSFYVTLPKLTTAVIPEKQATSYMIS